MTYVCFRSTYARVLTLLIRSVRPSPVPPSSLPLFLPPSLPLPPCPSLPPPPLDTLRSALVWVRSRWRGVLVSSLVSCSLALHRADRWFILTLTLAPLLDATLLCLFAGLNTRTSELWPAWFAPSMAITYLFFLGGSALAVRRKLLVETLRGRGRKDQHRCDATWKALLEAVQARAAGSESSRLCAAQGPAVLLPRLEEGAEPMPGEEDLEAGGGGPVDGEGGQEGVDRRVGSKDELQCFLEAVGKVAAAAIGPPLQRIVQVRS